MLYKELSMYLKCIAETLDCNIKIRITFLKIVKFLV